MAGAEQLPVAGVVGKAESAPIKHPQKTLRAAAVLQIGRPRLGEAGQIELSRSLMKLISRAPSRSGSGAAGTAVLWP